MTRSSKKLQSRMDNVAHFCELQQLPIRNDCLFSPEKDPSYLLTIVAALPR